MNTASGTTITTDTSTITNADATKTTTKTVITSHKITTTNNVFLDSIIACSVMRQLLLSVADTCTSMTCAKSVNTKGTILYYFNNCDYNNSCCFHCF